MYQCELFSFKKNKDDCQKLRDAQDGVRSILDRCGVQLQQITEIDQSAGKLSSAVLKQFDDCDMYLFANALNSTDDSSFRKLFYQLISSLEAGVAIDEEHKDLKPKVKVTPIGDLGNGYQGYCFSFRGKRFIALPSASLTGKEIDELIKESVDTADRIFSQQSTTYPEGIAYYDAEGREVDASLNRDIRSDETAMKKKQGFFKSFIPLKEDSRKQKIRKIIVLIAIAVFIAALIYVLDFYIFAPMRNNAVTSEIQEIAYNNGDSDGDNGGREQDWDALKAINDEIVGWITIPDTVIDYPVLYHEGDDRYNQYYLHRNYKKDSSEYGSIFIDYRSTDSVDSRNCIMHGHDMNDGSMFAGMLKYAPKGDLKGDLKYYQEHPVIKFNTEEEDAKWKIISVFKTSTRYEQGEFFNYMQGEFNSDAEYMNFIYNCRIRSFFDIPVTVNEDDDIITLSTCCYEFYQWRMVIVARKVRPGEDANVDVDLASYNSDPLFPDVYYQRYGGTRPDPLTFKTANAKGKVSWYDGKGNLEGSEDLTATIASNPTEPPTEKPKPGATKAPEPTSVTFYQVIYRNFDGTQYAAYNIKEGDPVPTPDGQPLMPEDEYYIYEFDGWDKDVDGVNFDKLNCSVEIYPKFTPIEKEE